MAQLSNDDFFATIDPESNSVAILANTLPEMRTRGLQTFSPATAKNLTASGTVNSKSCEGANRNRSCAIGKKDGPSCSQPSIRSKRKTPNVPSPFDKSRTRSCRRLTGHSRITPSTSDKSYSSQTFAFLRVEDADDSARQIRRIQSRPPRHEHARNIQPSPKNWRLQSDHRAVPQVRAPSVGANLGAEIFSQTYRPCSPPPTTRPVFPKTRC